MFGKIFREYCLSSSLHGLRFIAEPERHWTERFLWITCCILSWIGSFMLINSAYKDFQNNSLSFSADTTYLDWNTDFISIVICEEFKPAHVTDYVKQNIKDIQQRNLNRVSDAIAQIAFYDGKQNFIKRCYRGNFATGFKFDPTRQCPFENFTSMITAVRSKCQDLFHHCQWNDQEFDCCKYFLPLHGELGVCYAINNFQSEGYGKQKEHLDLKSNRSLGPGKMFLNFSSANTKMKMYLVAKDELPTLNTPSIQQIEIGGTPVHHIIEFKVTEVINLPGVQNLDVEQRRCKFSDENMDLVIFKQYSFSACLVECRMNKSLEFCNCTIPLLPINSTTSCNLDGLMCFAADSNIRTLKNEWDNKANGIACNCMQGCNELNLDVIRSEREPSQFSTTAVVQMNHLPSIRYKRQVVRGKLDLVVSMGGTAGLFLGASLLSLVEFIYYFVIRPVSEIIGSNTKQKHMPSEPHVGSAYISKLPLRVQLGKKV